MPLRLDKWTEVIEVMYGKDKMFAGDISRSTDITYSYTSKVVKELKDIGIVEDVKDSNKRTNFFKLTDKGNKLAFHVMKVKERLGLKWDG